MSLDLTYRVGALVLALTSVLTGRIGYVVVPVILVLTGLLALRRRLDVLARDRQDWHRSFVILLCIESAIELGFVWHMPTIGTLIFAAGTMCNALVISLNGMRMPFVGKTHDPCYVTIGPDTRLWWLGDVIADRPVPGARWRLSLGDLLELLGIWVFAAELWLARL